MTILRVKRASGLISKAKGLIGQQSVYPTLFKTRFGIHTFGMKVPLDVLVLDKNNQVVKLKDQLLPNHFFFWNPLHQLVVEMPVGFIKRKQIKMKTEIKLKVIT